MTLPQKAEVEDVVWVIPGFKEYFSNYFISPCYIFIFKCNYYVRMGQWILYSLSLHKS